MYGHFCRILKGKPSREGGQNARRIYVLGRNIYTFNYIILKVNSNVNINFLKLTVIAHALIKGATRFARLSPLSPRRL